MKFSFQLRIVLLFSVMVVLIIMIGLFAYITTQSLQRVSQAILKENVASLKAAEELELALLHQKGYVTSYFLDGDRKWLITLEEKKKEFGQWYQQAQQAALTEDEKVILEDVLKLYSVYDGQRDKAIRLFQAGQIKEGSHILLDDMKKSTNVLYQRCEDLILANEALIAQSEFVSQRNVARMIFFIWMMICVTLLLGGIGGFFISKKFNQQLIRHAQLSSLGQIAANIAHEIRNPITSINMRLYTLQKEMENNQAATEDLQVIQEDLHHMERTVKNFLDFSRPPEPKFEVFDIKSVLNATVMLIMPKAQACNVVISKDYFDSQCPLVKIDKEQMRRAFLNIMLNAVEAMPQGGSLKISLLAEHGMANIVFQDSGKGIAFLNKAKIFDPFFTTKPEGTGLGLFITSRIIEAHRGRISVDSKEGGGASIVISLPV